MTEAAIPLTALSALALLVALAVDRWLGEPPVRLHPVVWMGNYLGWAGRWLQRHTRAQPADGLPGTPDWKAFWLGALAWSVGAAVVYTAFWFVQNLLYRSVAAELGAIGAMGAVWSGLLVAVLVGVALKPLLAWAMLKSEVLAVEAALDAGQGGSLEGGRERLRWLVSRDVAALSESGVRESAIESLAENLNDSVVAPIFWFVLLGLPGAALYRFANTADAMWGYRGVYHGQHWEWAGKWAARADDCLSWLPARITGVLLALVAGRGGAQLRREAARTPSPNSGWPMAAMALGLGVCLQKPGVYALNATGHAPRNSDTVRAVAYASKALASGVIIAQIATIFIAIGGVHGGF